MPDDDKKKVHILVPKGFQNRELLKSEQLDPDHPEVGKCIRCRGTGCVILGVILDNPHVVDGKIIDCIPKFQAVKCKCSWGQFWIRFHPTNVQARVLPHFRKEIREMMELEKRRIIEACGGNYNPHQDTFLKDIGYVPPQNKPKLVTVEDVVKQQMKKDGIIE